eukprot:CAMPEP_0113274076 /NCGR_PEP_ID=MMETSP0008_2-20120614/24204_1 /TAXON_ID=97485 /ORGANISM="Prymnesium parvum" /LENGTH=96 /DNA_ID=CAMNT_0000123661 /DNA_START=597 /DNA_END=884 /DNA_ORIENTATION=- /assembly_acc=CAM_ASM_000153
MIPSAAMPTNACMPVLGLQKALGEKDGSAMRHGLHDHDAIESRLQYAALEKYVNLRARAGSKTVSLPSLKTGVVMLCRSGRTAIPAHIIREACRHM